MQQAFVPFIWVTMHGFCTHFTFNHFSFVKHSHCIFKRNKKNITEYNNIYMGKMNDMILYSFWMRLKRKIWIERVHHKMHHCIDLNRNKRQFLPRIKLSSSCSFSIHILSYYSTYASSRVMQIKKKRSANEIAFSWYEKFLNCMRKVWVTTFFSG